MSSPLVPFRPQDSTAFGLKEVVKNDEKSLNFARGSLFYILGDFDNTIATEIIPQLIENLTQQIELSKDRAQKGGRITFYINSFGGWAMYAYNLITLMEYAKQNGIIVETHVFGYAYSCGSLIACAGSKGHRYIGPFAEHCCHLGQIGTWSRNDVEHRRESIRVDSYFDQIRAIYKRYATIKNLDEAIHDDSLFIRGQDIIANGLADRMTFEFPKLSAPSGLLTSILTRKRR